MGDSLGDFERINTRQNKLNSLDVESKQENYAKVATKLSNPNIIGTKFNWSILTSFLTGKKIPCIPPIFRQNKFITDLRQNS